MTGNSAIFSFVRLSENSYVPSCKIAMSLADWLDVPAMDRRDEVPTGLETLIIVNGAYAFVAEEVRAMLGRAIETARNLIWVQQDYTIIPPKPDGNAQSPFRAAFRRRHELGLEVDYWTTCESFSRPGPTRSGHVAGGRSRYINWNVLTFDPTMEYVPLGRRAHADSLLYYGAYRVLLTKNKKDRAPYFRRYFGDPVTKTTISCLTTKFEETFTSPNVTHVRNFADLRAIQQYGLGLYLEDQASHVEFHSSANRFYEMLSAGLGMVFQPEAARTMSKAGFEIDDFLVWSAGEIADRMRNAGNIGDRQRERWYDRVVEERHDLPSVVIDAWVKYRGAS